MPNLAQRSVLEPVDENFSYANLPAQRLIELALEDSEGTLTDKGALAVNTGTRTGRSPKDRFIVRSSENSQRINWGSQNQPIERVQFDALWQRVSEHVNKLEHYLSELHVGASADHYLPINVTTTLAWHSLFARNIFIRPSTFNPKSFPPWQILSDAHFECIPERDGCNSDATVMIDFEQRKVLIAGMLYGGEMKKAMFTVQNYLLPDADVLPMHCAANSSDSDTDTRVSLFFGLSGTGKTTLSADPELQLIGDDEHGWSSEGVFNLEGGCYAKCIRLNRDSEPLIWDAIRDGAIVENVIIDPRTKTPDYNDGSLTENTRCCYPREHIPGRNLENSAGQPDAVVFLSCDINGVLPPVAMLSHHAAAYYFLNGYTSLIASTEGGKGIHATFSSCFGAPFFPLHVEAYAELLIKRLRQAQAQVYMVNTGWTGGAGDAGERFPIEVTRSIIRAIQSGELNAAKTEQLEQLNLTIPCAVNGVDSRLLNPRNTWPSVEAYDEKAAELRAKFHKNFARFKVSPEISAAAPPA